ncbi:MAG: 2-aminoethylphosphonate ABC transporter permease subunit [Pseudolabrys sp.]
MRSMAAAERSIDFSSPAFWVLPPFAVLATIFLYPLSLIVHEALTGGKAAVSLAGFVGVIGSTMFVRALFNTIRIALTATAGCLALGFTLALIYSFVRFPGRAAVAKLLDTFIALPTFLIALAFTFIYGSAGLLNQSIMTVTGAHLPPIDFLYSSWGVVLAEITVYSPFVLRPLIATFSLLDPAQIEVAASLGAKPFRIIREVIFPAALPALLAGGSLCLLLTVNEFGIVLFIGAKGVITLPLLVYDKAIQEFDYTTACIIATVNVLLSLSLYSLYRMAISSFGGRRAAVV